MLCNVVYCQVILDAFGKKTEVLTKSTYADLVTETDKNVEEMIIGCLRKKFPTHRYLVCAIRNGSMKSKDNNYYINATNKIVKIGPAIPEICWQTDRHSQTDRNTLLPYRGGVNVGYTSVTQYTFYGWSTCSCVRNAFRDKTLLPMRQSF